LILIVYREEIVTVMEAKVEPPVIDEHVCELCKCHVNESDWQVGTYFYF